MRITFVVPPPDNTGGNRVIAIYAERLQRRGHQVEVVSVRMPRPTLREIVRKLKKRQWPWPSRSAPAHYNALPNHRPLAHAGPVTDADLPDADVVVATWWETAHWVAALSPSKGAKVHFMQDYETWGGPRELVDATYRLPLAKIVISRWMEDLLADKFGTKPLALIPNSVDTDKFSAPPRGKQPVPTFGMTYALKHNKGCDISIKAVEQARREVPQLKLVAMGNDKPAAELPLPAGTEFTHQARDQQIPAIYARCDAWLFGTRWEGFGLPVLEAMACRTPVIGTPGGAAPEIIAKGGGILVPHDDPPAMAQAIVQICRLGEDEWRKLSDAALATVTGFTWDDATTLFEKALTDALTLSPKPKPSTV